MENSEKLKRFKTTVAELLAEAQKQGATAAEAGLSVENGLSVTARLGDVETLEYHGDQSLAVTVYFGRQKGSASTNDFSPASLQETVRAACSIAGYASEDRYAGLPDKNLLATTMVDLDLYHPWTLDAKQAIELAIECEDGARNYSAEISNSEGATVNSHQALRIFGNSLGFLEGYLSTRHSISCAVLAERDHSMQRDYWYSVARHANDLEPVSAIGVKAAQRTLKRLGAGPLKTRQCPVMFAAEIASGLVGALVGAISGGNLYRKSSFLLDALDKQIMPAFVHIHEQPFLKSALGSANYDAEGVATRPRSIVTNGVLQSYLLSSYSARKLGLETTGNAGGVHNLTVDPGESDFAGLLRQMDTGLLVTELMGQGINMVTGDYSRGASGFWVEKGEIQFPVEEITVAGNLKDMFRQIVAIGNDTDLRGNIRTGSILIERMSVAGG